MVLGDRQALRLTRVAAFAIAVTLLALGAHAIAGGMLPSPGVAILAGLAVAALSAPLTRRERGGAAVLGATAASQLALHVTFTLSMAAACGIGGAGVGADAGSARRSPGMGGLHAMAGMSGLAGRGTWTGSGAPVVHPSCAASGPGAAWLPTPPMLAAHVGAALLMAWWLTRGERAAGRLLTLLAPLGRWLVPVSPAGEAGTPRARAASPVGGWVESRSPRRRRDSPGAAAARRGPPGVAAA